MKNLRVTRLPIDNMPKVASETTVYTASDEITINAGRCVGIAALKRESENDTNKERHAQLGKDVIGLFVMSHLQQTLDEN